MPCRLRVPLLREHLHLSPHVALDQSLVHRQGKNPGAEASDVREGRPRKPLRERGEERRGMVGLVTGEKLSLEVVGEHAFPQLL